MNDVAMLGMLAALGASLLWGINSIMFTYAGNRVGSDAVTHIRLWLALVIIVVIHLAMFGTIYPTHTPARQTGFLLLSGVSGFVIGDMFLFEAFVLIGTQPSLLIRTMAPAFAAFFAMIFLGEMLTFAQFLAIGLTLFGITLVVRQRSGKDKRDATTKSTENSDYLRGMLYALIGALGQAGAMALAKPGMEGGTSPVSATLIRLTSAVPVMFLVVLSRGRLKDNLRAFRDISASTAITLGTMLGTVLGVFLAMYAVQHTHVGVASTLMELTPVVVLIISTVFLHCTFQRRQWLGTLIALSGSVLLMLA